MTPTFILLRTHFDGDPQTVLLFIIVLVIIVVVSVYFSRKSIVLRGLRKKGVKKIKDFSDGDTGRVIGKVVFAGETILAPLSKRKCVYYHVIVEQYLPGGRGGDWRKIIEEEEKADVVIYDGTGYALIDAENAMGYLVHDVNYSSRWDNKPTPTLEKFLARHKVDSKNVLGATKTLRYREGVLEKGEKFVVAGEGQWNETKDHHLELPSEKVLVLIPGKKEELFLTDDPVAVQES